MKTALENLWPYTGELFKAAEYEIAVGMNPSTFHTPWFNQVEKVLQEATLPISSTEPVFMHTGGKQGVHSEQLGFLLAELQYMQRAYPDSNW
jgi:ring-1,2-phenylacetyl-CoA epoxidase subunit PaaC